MDMSNSLNGVGQSSESFVQPTLFSSESVTLIQMKNKPKSDHRFHTHSRTTSIAIPSNESDHLYVNLKRPYPLILLSIIDSIFTFKHLNEISRRLIFFPFIRITILIWITLNSQWRLKKSHILFVVGLSLVNSIWEVCTLILMRSTRQDNESDKGSVPRTSKFLVITSLLSILEYLLFLILLRISPNSPTNSTLPKTYNTSSIRLPTSSAAHTPSSIRFKDSNTPSSVRFATYHQHRRNVSRGTLRSVQSAHYDNESTTHVRNEEDDVFTSGAETSFGQLERRSIDRLGRDIIDGYTDNEYEGLENEIHDSHELYHYDYDSQDDEPQNENIYDESENHEFDDVINHRYIDEENGQSEYEEEEEDSSSVSSSSIIDLPLPQSPSLIPIPITLPRSTSLNLNALNISRVSDQLGSSPIVGPIIRKTKSSKLLRSSWTNSTNWLNNNSNRGEDRDHLVEDNYGTFE
ncbi:uncharacterized protein I206_104158 [Kwoniella pini CBS 10737]|uniref:Uncharacterized protein n=1 Tax=Kwoniella pini CBS 10737 TaxID=1296096 RepID=A0A1B9I2H9_9TREE|nr:uncharacterized protein I206_04267 [Kwoniella pini CBS 10737]OCF49743.1 hypothetical protein I206_04267 [Kwoniella pini CBS 10737]